MRRGLFWFRHDLRLDDNAALVQLATGVDQLICVFVIDPRWFKPGHYQSAHLGKFRHQFLQESLNDLANKLTQYNQHLLVVEGLPVDEISKLINAYKVDIVASGYHPGVYERQQWQRIKHHCPQVVFQQSYTNTLWSLEQLPFTLQSLPDSFTPFRKKVEQLAIDKPIKVAAHLPPCPPARPISQNTQLTTNCDSEFRGGSHAGTQQLTHFLYVSQAVASYKQTRNGLQGWDYSSKLSAWLANGSLSARQIYSALKQYESEYQANESTYWLYFELLWREYFQWYLMKHQHRLFKFRGVRDKKLLTTFNPQRFAKWCQGDTPYPIINACMQQLNTTGYMSNRGRQLVASCLVNELQMDWRYGAAYFEQQLIDFDVASNWGNWQYLAGVGADPRGHRHFDLAKQAAQYDPDGSFVANWQSKQSSAPLDATDAADWPIE